MFQKIWNEKYSNGDSLNKYPWDKIVSFIFKHYPKNVKKQDVKILEMGFGSGCNLWFCAREGFDCYGVEASAVAVDHAKNWFKKDQLNAELTCSDFAPINKPDNFFDLVIDRGSITCVDFDYAEKILQEIYRVINDTGYFCFNPYSTAHSSHISGTKLSNGLTRITTGTLQGVGDIKFYDREEIHALVEGVGFKIIEERHIEEECYYPMPTKHAEWFLVLGKK